MLDANLRPWLLEVNCNPYLNKQNQFHEVLLKKAIEDLFRLVIDPLFKGTVNQMDSERIEADMHIDSLMPEHDLSSLKGNTYENGFDLLCNLKEMQLQAVHGLNIQAMELTNY